MQSKFNQKMLLKTYPRWVTSAKSKEEPLPFTIVTVKKLRKRFDSKMRNFSKEYCLKEVPICQKSISITDLWVSLEIRWIVHVRHPVLKLMRFKSDFESRSKQISNNLDENSFIFKLFVKCCSHEYIDFECDMILFESIWIFYSSQYSVIYIKIDNIFESQSFSLRQGNETAYFLFFLCQHVFWDPNQFPQDFHFFGSHQIAFFFHFFGLHGCQMIHISFLIRLLEHFYDLNCGKLRGWHANLQLTKYFFLD